MSNNINPYDPIWYVNEALIQLEKSLGLAARVFRGVDKNPQQPGSTIQLRRPGTFTAADAPSVAQDIKPDSLQVSLNYWREVKFSLTDKEISYGGERIIEDHIRPAAVALADDIDTKLVALYKYVPYFNSVTLSSATVADVLAARRTLFTNRAPMSDLHFMVDGYLEEKLLGLAAFSQYQGAGQLGADTQMRGTLGTRYGFEFFSNQNVPSHLSGTSADVDGAVDYGSGTTGVYPVGATTVHIDGVTSGGTAKAGDIITFTGDSQAYAITADVTFTSGEGDVTIDPPLKKALDENQVCAIGFPSASGGTKTQNIAFHRNAFCLAMAPLPRTGDGLGARMAVQVDPVSQLALRSRIWYDGDTSKVLVALDCLYGVKCLDGNLAVRASAS